MLVLLSLGAMNLIPNICLTVSPLFMVLVLHFQFLISHDMTGMMSAVDYCITSVLHVFNSHVSKGANPSINKAINALLMHGFGTLNMLK